ncbi:unnamed protein product [Prorocentrum cordatum]|nr:unnamed protein product [Polarella glacialis]
MKRLFKLLPQAPPAGRKPAFGHGAGPRAEDLTPDGEGWGCGSPSLRARCATPPLGEKGRLLMDEEEEEEEPYNFSRSPTRSPQAAPGLDGLSPGCGGELCAFRPLLAVPPPSPPLPPGAGQQPSSSPCGGREVRRVGCRRLQRASVEGNWDGGQVQVAGILPSTRKASRLASALQGMGPRDAAPWGEEALNGCRLRSKKRT